MSVTKTTILKTVYIKGAGINLRLKSLKNTSDGVFFRYSKNETMIPSKHFSLEQMQA